VNYSRFDCTHYYIFKRKNFKCALSICICTDELVDDIYDNENQPEIETWEKEKNRKE
jgi:hypothetical protein